MILILSALAEEIRKVADLLTSPLSLTSYPYCLGGDLDGVEAVVGATGFGRAQAEDVGIRLISEFDPELVFYTGIAGAINPHYHRGDLVVVREIHSLEPADSGGSYVCSYRTDTELRERALSHRRHGGYRVWEGDSITVDHFITDHQQIPVGLNGDIVAMEDSGIAIAANYYRKPLLVVRMISDIIGTPGSAKGFSRATDLAGRRYGELICQLLKG